MSTTRPYCLLMDGKLVDYFRDLATAIKQARAINLNRVRSSEDPSQRQYIKVVYDTPHETRTVHEE